MIMGLAGHFLDAPVTLGVIKTRDSELNLVSNPRRVSADGKSPVTPFGGRLAVLVDGGSYSASEIFSAGMQSVKRARVFGTRTAGGALPAVLERLPGGRRPPVRHRRLHHGAGRPRRGPRRHPRRHGCTNTRGPAGRARPGPRGGPRLDQGRIEVMRLVVRRPFGCYCWWCRLSPCAGRGPRRRLRRPLRRPW